MRTSSLLLVLISCGMHAWWNFIYKVQKGDQRFIAWSKVAEAVIGLPVFLIALRYTPVSLTALLPLAVVGAVLTGMNYLFLGLAYGRGDFSVVYPLSRASILLFLPVLAFVLTKQTVSPLGIGAMVLVVAGAVLSQSAPTEGKRQKHVMIFRSANLFALLAALFAAGYTIWDKHAVNQVPTFPYFYIYTTLSAIGYMLWLAFRKVPIDREPQPLSLSAVIQVGVLNTVAYVLVLLALKHSNPSYVVAVRLLSIGIGAALGWFLLRERVTPLKVGGIVLLVIGCVLISIA